MKKLSLILATVMAAALLLTGCFSATEPSPTATPTAAPTATASAATDATATVAPTATALLDTTDASDAPDATGNVEVSPSPSADAAQ